MLSISKQMCEQGESSYRSVSHLNASLFSSKKLILSNFERKLLTF